MLKSVQHVPFLLCVVLAGNGQNRNDDDDNEDEDDDPKEKKIPDTHEVQMQHVSKAILALAGDPANV